MADASHPSPSAEAGKPKTALVFAGGGSFGAVQVKAELESLDQTIDFHVAPPLCPLTGSPYDFSRTDELIERGAKRTEEWLAEGGLERRKIPHEMNAHKHH
jgi:NTE family protein